MRFFRVLAVLLSLFALSLSGDTIQLKTGERIEGTFKQATSTGATIEVGGQSITIPLEKVWAIFLGDAPSRTVARTDAIPALPPPSKVLETQGARSAEALNALRGLRSVTNSGIAYIEYHKRVLDARVSVRLLSGVGR